MQLTTATKLVLDELERAQKAHGSPHSCHEAYAVMLEELDELWDEIKANRGTTHRGVSEAVQVAAMAMRYLVDLCDEPAAAAHEAKVEAHAAKVSRPAPDPGPDPYPRLESYYGGYSG